MGAPMTFVSHPKIVLVLLISSAFFASVTSLKCYTCNAPGRCAKSALVECTAAAVTTTQYEFSFLEQMHNQPTTNDGFSCINYSATLKNHTRLELLGCISNRFNPCEVMDQVPANAWACKFCDTKDGCNDVSSADAPKSMVWLLVSLLMPMVVIPAVW